MELVPLIGAPLEARFRELRLQEVEKWSCMIDRGQLYSSCGANNVVGCRVWRWYAFSTRAVLVI
jgi:DMSO/TMAO reductase YedYZ molybdopterin-dependent catalytic subunit